MKFKVIFFFLLFTHTITYSQWYQAATLNSETDCQGHTILTNVIFVDPQTSFLVYQRPSCSPSTTGYHNVYKTNNSFQSLQFITGCNPGSFMDLDVISADTFVTFDYCFGYKSFKTFDGGASWINFPVNRPHDLSFVNDHLAYGFIGSNYYRYSNDSIFYVSNLSAITTQAPLLYVFDSLSAIVQNPTTYGSTFDNILRTNDGGLNWFPITLPGNRSFKSGMEILNDSIAYLRADSGYIYKTIDRGASWYTAVGANSYGLIRFLNERKFYSLTTNSNSYLDYNFSTDSGYTWITQPINYSIYPVNIKMFNDTVGYIHAFTGTYGNAQEIILKTTHGVGIKTIANPIQLLTVYPNPTSDLITIDIPIDLENQNSKLYVYNSLGILISQKTVVHYNSKKLTEKIDLPNGIYYFKLSNNKFNFSAKVIVQRD